MNRFHLTALCMVAALGISGCNKPDTQSRNADERASAVQDAAEDACDSRSGNARDICLAEAEGRANVAKAELAAASNPSERNRLDLLMAKANATYAVAKERCDDLSGNAADVCRKEAEQAFATAQADAELAAKVADAKSDEREATAEAVEETRETTADAREESWDAKRDADYALAKEKCDGFAGDMKHECMDRADAEYARR